MKNGLCAAHRDMPPNSAGFETTQVPTTLLRHDIIEMNHIRTLLLCLTLLLAGPAIASPAATDQDTYRQLEIFSSVLNLVQHHYVEEVDTKTLIEGAIGGMLAALDPHSSYLDPDDFRELQTETSGSFTGIGIEITIRDDLLTVVSPIEGTPAAEAGIEAGDAILEIDGEATKDMTLMEAVKRLRGPKGSTVTVTIYRQGWQEGKKITLVRDVIPLQSVKTKVVAPGYAAVRITNFQAHTARDLLQALEDLSTTESLDGLILDLRNNPGGLLEQAVQVADVFLKEGIIVSTRGRTETETTVYRAHASDTNYDLPMVVLVNAGSASAAEIVAGALKDHHRALVLGTQTFGKGSVQTIIPMNNGAGLRLTTARYYTPNGTSIQATGITPDIVVHNLPTPAKPPESRPVVREKDLKGHITNDHPASPTDEGPAAADIAADQQLYTALMILKGVSIFEGMNR